MRNRLGFLVTFSVAVCFVCAMPMSAQATTYKLVDFGPGPKGYIQDLTAVAVAVNNTYLAGNFVYTRDSCGKDCSFNVYHAAAWPRSGSPPIDITPPLINFVEAWANGGAGNILVGTGITNNGGYFGYSHALLWHGTSLIWKDINPAGDSGSYAYATNGSQIVGSGVSTSLHALLWSLTNLSSPIDLLPGGGYTSSEALGSYATRQVGYAVTNSTTPTQHAMLWSGSAASAVDLTPAGVTAASAYAVSSALQVGCGVVPPAFASHALLWRGTAGSLRDLNPTGFIDSCARAVHSGVEAGYGHTSARVLHALVWTGTAASAVDLQLSMPSAYQQSEAFAIDSKGNIIGAAYYASSAGSAWHAIMWMPQ